MTKRETLGREGFFRGLDREHSRLARFYWTMSPGREHQVRWVCRQGQWVERGQNRTTPLSPLLSSYQPLRENQLQIDQGGLISPNSPVEVGEELSLDQNATPTDQFHRLHGGNPREAMTTLGHVIRVITVP